MRLCYSNVIGRQRKSQQGGQVPETGSPLTSVGDSGVERSEVGVGKRLGRFRLINTLFSADDHGGRARDMSTNQ